MFYLLHLSYKSNKRREKKGCHHRTIENKHFYRWDIQQR